MTRAWYDIVAETITSQRPSGPTKTRIASVSAVQENGSVNLRVRGGVLWGVPCLRGYTPVKGDVVEVRVAPSGWLVLGSTVNAAVEPAPPEEEPDPAAPDPQTVNAANSESYRGGQRRDDVGYAIQGDWSGWGANTGVWTYGTALNTAMTAGTVKKATITLARSSSRHGHYSDVQVRLYTHVHTSLPQQTPDRLAGPWTVGALELGEQDTFNLPNEAIASLQGSGRGLLAYAGTTRYIHFTRGTGSVRITYSAP